MKMKSSVGPETHADFVTALRDFFLIFPHVFVPFHNVLRSPKKPSIAATLMEALTKTNTLAKHVRPFE